MRIKSKFPTLYREFSAATKRKQTFTKRDIKVPLYIEDILESSERFLTQFEMVTGSSFPSLMNKYPRLNDASVFEILYFLVVHDKGRFLEEFIAELNKEYNTSTSYDVVQLLEGLNEGDSDFLTLLTR